MTMNFVDGRICVTVPCDPDHLTHSSVIPYPILIISHIALSYPIPSWSSHTQLCHTLSHSSRVGKLAGVWVSLLLFQLILVKSTSNSWFVKIFHFRCIPLQWCLSFLVDNWLNACLGGHFAYPFLQNSLKDFSSKDYLLNWYKSFLLCVNNVSSSLRLHPNVL